MTKLHAVTESSASLRSPIIATMHMGSPSPFGMVMPYAEWAAIEDNPRQRNTEKRAAKAKKGWLKHPSQHHAEGRVAVMPGGKLVRLDGHTRTYLWETGHFPVKPETMQVTVYSVENMKEAVDLYLTFDSKSAHETTSDLHDGVFNELKVTFQSHFCNALAFKNALSYASGARSIKDRIEGWLPELEFIDKLNVAAKQFNGGLVMAVLMTARRNPLVAADFWLRYRDSDGINGEDGSDAVARLKQEVESIMTNVAHGGGRDRMFAIAQVAFFFFESYVAERSKVRKCWRVKGIPVTDYRALATK